MGFKRLNINLVRRSQAKGGSFDAGILNNTVDEIITDLTSLSSEWNSKLVPMFSTVPDGTKDILVSAFKNGLDGKTLWVDFLANEAKSVKLFFNSIRSRPNTIKEQFEDVYKKIDAIESGSSLGVSGEKIVSILSLADSDSYASDVPKIKRIFSFNPTLYIRTGANLLIEMRAVGAMGALGKTGIIKLKNFTDDEDLLTIQFSSTTIELQSANVKIGSGAGEMPQQEKLYTVEIFVDDSPAAEDSLELGSIELRMVNTII